MTGLIATLPPSVSDATLLGSSAAADDSGSGLSFHDLVSIVNPLQHIPIVSTIYRAVTGDTIGPLEKIAGDTLYGGVWGLVSSVANVAYQEITGHDLGDQVMAFAEDQVGLKPLDLALNSSAPGSSDTAQSVAASGAVVPNTVASVAPQLSTDTPTVLSDEVTPTTLASVEKQLIATPAKLQSQAAPAKLPNDATARALMSAMNSKGIDPALSQRALTAYRKSLTAPAPSADSVPIF